MRVSTMFGWVTGLRVGWLAWGLSMLLGVGVGRAQTQPVAFVISRSSQHRAQVPFTTQRNLIIVAARLNGRGPYNFLLDTGVGTSLLTDPLMVDSLHLTRGSEYKLLGVGGTDSGLRAYEATNVRVSLADRAEAPGLSWLVLSSDVLDLSGYVGMPIHGIIGADLFRSFVVTIRPEQHQLVLTDPATYRAPRGRRWAQLPLLLDHDKAYITAEVRQLNAPPGAALPLRLLLDTGAGHALSLETTSDLRLHLPATRLRTDLGRGLTGLISGSLGRVATMQLGRYHLPSVLTSFPDSTQVHDRLSGSERLRNGSVGYEVLKRFTTVIDYPHRQLLLRPTAALREPFEHDMCGLDLLATGPDYRRYLVQRVVPNSPAASAGIAEGEELLSVNFLPIQVFSLTDLSHLLHSQDGRVLLLLLRRHDGELHTASIRLKRQI